MSLLIDLYPEWDSDLEALYDSPTDLVSVFFMMMFWRLHLTQRLTQRIQSLSTVRITVTETVWSLGFT